MYLLGILVNRAPSDKEATVSDIAKKMPRTVTPAEVTEIMDGLVAKGVMKKDEDVYAI